MSFPLFAGRELDRGVALLAGVLLAVWWVGVRATAADGDSLRRPRLRWAFAEDLGEQDGKARLVDGAGVRLGAAEQAVVLEGVHRLRYVLGEPLVSGAGTVAFWVRLSEPATAGGLNTLTGDRRECLLCLSDQAGAWAWLSIPEFGAQVGVSVRGCDGVAVWSPATGWTAGTWHHVAWTWERQRDEQALYLDGQVVHEGGRNRWRGGWGAAGAMELTLGARHEGGRYSDLMSGALTEVCLFQEALDPESVGSLARQRPAGRAGGGGGAVLGRQTATALPVSGAVRVDGLLDEQVWQGPATLRGFRRCGADGQAVAGTRGWLACDEQGVYLAMRVEREAGEVFRQAKRQKTDAEDIFGDSCIEWFLCPRGQGEVYQFVVNPRGVQEEVLSGAVSFETRWEAQVRHDEAGMTVEMAVPWARLGLEKGADDVWQMNVNRSIYGENGEVRRVTWTPLEEGGFYQPGCFGLAAMPVVNARFIERFREVVARPGPVFVQEEGLSIWAESSLYRPMRRDHVTGVAADGDALLRIELAGGEYEAAHFVVRSEEAIETVAVRVSELTGEGGAVLAADQVVCHELVYVNEEFADVLAPGESFYVGADQACGFRVTVYARPDTPAGRYRGQVRLRLGAARTYRLPIEVRVYGFNIPAQSTVGTMLFSYWPTRTPWDDRLGQGVPMPGRSNPYFFTAEYEAYMRGLYENFARHRLCGNDVMPYSLNYYVEGLGWEPAGQAMADQFKRWAAFWREQGRYVGRIFPWGPAEAAGLAEQAKEVGGYYRFWGKLVEELGIAEYVWADAVIDEPHGSEAARKTVRAWAALVKQAAPNLRRAILLAGHSLDRRDPDNLYDYVGFCDIWGVNRRRFGDPNYAGFFRERQRAGEQVYWYIHSNCVLAAEPMTTRTFFWDMYRCRIDGCLYYSVDYFWPNIVNKEDRAFRIDSGRSGYSLGEGTVLWPGRFGVYDSLRWENVRDGLEDLEVLRLWGSEAQASGAEPAVASEVDRVLGQATPAVLMDVRRELYETMEQRGQR